MATAAETVSAKHSAPCLARRPVLTKDERVLGYEVLFHEASASEAAANPNAGHCGLVDAIEHLGLEVLCDGRLAFIECTQQMLEHDALLALPPDKVVAKIEPEVSANAAVLAAWERLKHAGHKIALDNAHLDADRAKLLPFADFLTTDSRSRTESYPQIVAAHSGKPYKLVLQNVDSRAEYKDAVKAGFTLFQGYFFHHPENMHVRQIPAGQTSKLRLLQAISAPEIDFALVEELIRHDASLCYRLLRYLNSPLLGFAVPVQSVHQAVRLLGDTAITRWIRTATAVSLGHPKCSELVLSSLVRARFGELLTGKVDHGSADLFLLGMLSLMDAILETPMDIVLDGLAFDPHAKAALLAIRNGGGARLSPICDLMAAREKGEWERAAACTNKLNLAPELVNRAYIDATQWAHQMTRASDLSSK